LIYLTVKLLPSDKTSKHECKSVPVSKEFKIYCIYISISLHSELRDRPQESRHSLLSSGFLYRPFGGQCPPYPLIKKPLSRERFSVTRQRLQPRHRTVIAIHPGASCQRPLTILRHNLHRAAHALILMRLRKRRAAFFIGIQQWQQALWLPQGVQVAIDPVTARITDQPRIMSHTIQPATDLCRPAPARLLLQGAAQLP